MFVFVCVYVCVHMSVCLCLCLCSYVCLFASISVFICLFVCVYVCVHMCAFLRLCLCSYVCFFASISVFICVLVCVYVCVHVSVCLRLCLCAYVRQTTGPQSTDCKRNLTWVGRSIREVLQWLRKKSLAVPAMVVPLLVMIPLISTTSLPHRQPISTLMQRCPMHASHPPCPQLSV